MLKQTDAAHRIGGRQSEDSLFASKSQEVTSTSCGEVIWARMSAILPGNWVNGGGKELLDAKRGTLERTNNPIVKSTSTIERSAKE